MTWLYIKSEKQLWTVGFYDPHSLRWQAEGDYGTAEAAAARVHWLNGGIGAYLGEFTAALTQLSTTIERDTKLHEELKPK